MYYIEAKKKMNADLRGYTFSSELSSLEALLDFVFDKFGAREPPCAGGPVGANLDCNDS